MVAPHNHPRATEYLLNVAGPPLSAGSFQENGAPYVQGNLAAGSVTVLPLGSIHYVSNEGCDPAFIVAGFNSETPGVGFLSSMYTAFDPQTVNAAFGGVGAQVFNGMSRQIPFYEIRAERLTISFQDPSSRQLGTPNVPPEMWYQPEHI